MFARFAVMLYPLLVKARLAVAVSGCRCLMTRKLMRATKSKLSRLRTKFALQWLIPMTEKHYISFIAHVTSDTAQIVKLYPEQDVCVRFKRKGGGIMYAYCNKHGMYKQYI